MPEMRSAAIGIVVCGVLMGAACRGAPESKPVPSLAPLADPAAATYLVRAQAAYERADFGAALALVDSAAQQASPGQAGFQADLSFLRGRIYTALNRDDDAQAAYERALSLKPDYRGAWLNLGNEAFRAGQYQEALAAYRREQAAHDDPSLYVYLGRTYAELGWTDSARVAYEQAIAAERTYAEAYARLAQLHDRDGAPDKALPYARRALTFEPENASYQYLAGLLLLRTGQTEAALEHLRRVASLRPYDHEVQYNLGQALIRTGQEAEGRAALETAERLRSKEREVAQWETATRLRPDDPAAWATYGYGLGRVGRLEDAVRAYKTALYLDPENTEVRFALANAHLQQGEPGEALEQYQMLLARDTTLEGAWFNAGIALARLGQPEAARQAWQTVLRHNPAHAQAEAYLARLPPP